MNKEEYEPIHNLPSHPKREIYTNARLKEYPHLIEEQVCNKSIFPMGVGDIKRKRRYTVPTPGKAKNPERAQQESCRRAKSRIMDIARCNDFGYMMTLTIDGSKLDRYDSKKIYSKMKSFLTNASQRHGFQYIIIPEYHALKQGGKHPAIHLHGLCNLGTLEITPAFNPHSGEPLTENGSPTYNLPSWIWGFSKIVPLGENSEHAALYVSKYISKGNDKIFGKRYLSSRNLIKSPKIIPLEPIDYFEFRDEKKIESGMQTECELYPHVRLLTEILKQSGD